MVGPHLRRVARGTIPKKRWKQRGTTKARWKNERTADARDGSNCTLKIERNCTTSNRSRPTKIKENHVLHQHEIDVAQPNYETFTLVASKRKRCPPLSIVTLGLLHQNQRAREFIALLRGKTTNRTSRIRAPRNQHERTPTVNTYATYVRI